MSDLQERANAFIMDYFDSKDVSLFVDKDNLTRVLIRYKVDNHYEVRELYDKTFIAWLSNNMRISLDELIIPSVPIRLNAYRDEAIALGNTRKIYYRIAGNSKALVYFLADKDWHYVYVDKNGYRITKKTSPLFMRTANTKEQVQPKGNKDILDVLRRFVNLKDDDFILFAVHLIQSFFPRSSHFISIVSSSHGTGKTTFSKLFREIVSPAVAPQAIMPKNADELKNHLANNLVVVFDNSERLSNELSDILCGATTGTAMTKRTLYTTADETILKFKNTILINGIDICPHKKDLLERSLLFELQPISTKDRKSEIEFWQEFRKAKPYIMGAIFTAISKALAIREDLKLTETHRMSDAYTDMVAIAIALGIEKDKFIKIFYDNKEKLEKIQSDENYFVSGIVDFMSKKTKKTIRLTMTELYFAIKEEKVIESRYFPKSASAFSRKLKAEEQSLRLLGYRFFIDVKRDATYITLGKIKVTEME